VTAGRLLDRIDPAPFLRSLRGRSVNFRREEVDDSWHHDRHRVTLGREAVGDPEPDGLWQTACRLVTAYEMADPRRIRAVYDPSAPLRGRDMVLEGRFWRLRYYMGVRITDVIDERDGDEHCWGWAYETLEGHLERGRMSYEVLKDRRSGEVDLRIEAYSEGAPTLGPVTGLGWAIFGRRTQLDFYRECGRRLTRLAQARRGDPSPVPPRRTADGLVLAPSDARPTRGPTIASHHPG
jgi:uncharacterized protein (UPF0548 family)